LEQVVGAAFSHPHFVRAGSANEVSNAFGANGTKKQVSYTVGIIIPANFDAELQADQTPQVQLFVNADKSNAQQLDLLAGAITNYARHVSTPIDPVTVQKALINPPASNDFSVDVSKFYSMAAVMTSFFAGLSIVANMVVEERERKTLRMLLVSPASMVDIVVGKSGVAFTYQAILALITLGITSGFTGQIPVTLLFILIGTSFTVCLGLLAAGIFQTTSATGAFGGVAGFMFIVPAFFATPFFGDNANGVVTIIKLLPTFYISDGIYHALSSVTTASSLSLDVGISFGATALLFILAVLALRRQTVVTARV
jgi:ABC-2 type transport system permease protein